MQRRSFLTTAAGVGLGFPYLGWKTCAQGVAPSESVRIAAFGANGRAWNNISETMRHAHTTLVASAEIDDMRADKVRKQFPEAKVYADYRELLERHEKEIDAVLVGTPDHMHAPIAMAAIQLGKHVYCEKPLTRTVYEVRQLASAAADRKIHSQMGNQLASGSGNKATAKAIAGGLIGMVVEVHSMNPKSWGAMKPLPDPTEPPENLHWDEWIGVGRMTPYIGGEYHPGQWRKRIGYGTGTLGDMACHIIHPWMKGLGAPRVLEVKSVGAAPVDAFSWPLNAKVEYLMKGTELTKGDFRYTWYDGREKPDDEVAKLVGGRGNVPGSGSIVVGTTGVLAVNHGNNLPRIFRDGQLTEDAPGKTAEANHHGEWIDAILGKVKETVCDFSYAGPMTEAVLLGTVAVLVPGETLKWDDAKGRFTNSEKANGFVRDTYRKGWEVKGL